MRYKIKREMLFTATGQPPSPPNDLHYDKDSSSIVWTGEESEYLIQSTMEGTTDVHQQSETSLKVDMQTHKAGLWTFDVFSIKSGVLSNSKSIKYLLGGQYIYLEKFAKYIYKLFIIFYIM